ncbi:MAG TPA: sn-glycerol-3-phosphate ABC transporter ATP-binding protein UgpC [Phycisphaerae bacterium]|nr:sn-glycerol-3-phosphate ABC transporter ATP-binding protein UgpC [Phycisphaerae bacterium]
MAVVALDSISKTYPGKPPVSAVEELSLRVADKELLVLVGPSGCGKTTTLRMIAGLEQPTAGLVTIGGRVVNDVAPKDRDIAMVFQNYALYPHMTVFKNMAFGLKMRRVPKTEIREKVTATARMLGIEHLLERKPKSLSGGERQRVAVGRAIVRTPQAFLFDEPLSNLDARLRVKMRSELKRLHRSLGATSIYVTHDQEEAMALGDKIAVMHRGVLQQCAPPREIYEHPVNRFVAGFVGVPPMNFLDGRIVQQVGVGRLGFDAGFGVLDLPERAQSTLAGRIGDAMVYGVRPQGVRLDANGPVKLKVTLVELLGRDADVYLQCPETGSRAGQNLVARVTADTQVTEGDTVGVSFDVDRVHVFESGENGMNVTYAGQAEGVAQAASLAEVGPSAN